eukprot:6169465-Pyramimonas_sp.AAC.1
MGAFASNQGVVTTALKSSIFRCPPIVRGTSQTETLPRRAGICLPFFMKGSNPPTQGTLPELAEFQMALHMSGG